MIQTIQLTLIKTYFLSYMIIQYFLHIHVQKKNSVQSKYCIDTLSRFAVAICKINRPM